MRITNRLILNLIMTAVLLLSKKK